MLRSDTRKLDLPDRIEFQTSPERPLAGNRPTRPLVRKYRRVGHAWGNPELEHSGAIYCARNNLYAAFFQRISKLHKLNRVFLI
jgi:hypothetical protein